MPWSIRPCPRPGCDQTISGNERFCDDHQAEHERTRGSAKYRGYGKQHRAIRARLLPDAYGKPCPRCGQIMTPSQALDLDHSAPLRSNPNSIGDRIVHAGCNRGKRGESDIQGMGGG